MMPKHNHQQKGVVLLTCLVFLLILLAILRFSLTSARVEEQKAGADLEIFTARESAQAAINFAEFYVREQGRRYCLSTGLSDTECDEQKDQFVNILFSLPDSELANVNLAAVSTDVEGVPNVNSLINNGFYSATYVEQQTGCQPFWACVDWDGDGTQDGAAQAVNRAAFEYTNHTNQTRPSIECVSPRCQTRDAGNPRFIIERFIPKDLAEENTALGGNRQLVIIRITAVGFGRGAPGANTTNSLLQSNYVLFNG